MANIPGYTPGFLLQDNRYNNALPPSQYDPNNVVDPMQAIAAQQAYAKQMFAMQNPRLALPQQFGAAIGSALQGRGQSAPAPSQGGPDDPVAAAIHSKAVAYGAQGMDAAAALYKAAGDVEQDPTLSKDPNAEKYVEKARSYAVKQGYSPEQEASRAFEKQKLPYDNLRLPNGTVVAAQQDTPEYKAYMTAGAVKSGELPQIPVGQRQEEKSGGKYVESQWDGSKWNKVASSSQPMQYQVTGTPDQMGSAGLMGQTGTTAANDKNIKELTDRGIATTNALRGIDKTLDTLNSNPGAVGTPGDLAEKGQNIVATAGSLASSLGMSPDLLKSSNYDWKGLDKMTGTLQGNAAAATKYHSQMVSLAYMMAAAQSNNNTDEKMTKQRVEANLEMLAEHSDDPSIVKNTMSSVRQQMKDNYQTQISAYKPQGFNSPVDQYESQRKQASAPKTDVDIKAAFRAGKMTREEAKAALAAHGYN